jgi:hypothetical protein
MEEHDRKPADLDEDAANESMVRQMEERRRVQPERRTAPGKAVAHERRQTCSYCHQPGDHPTPAHCLRALER